MKWRTFRNLMFHSLGIERCYKPRILIERPNAGECNQLEWAIASHLIDNPEFRFIQIGAFDGRTCDALHRAITRFGLKGVLVEPQSSAFARLSETYRDQPQLKLINAAVSTESGVRSLYTVRGESSLVASFDRQHLLKHGIAPDRIDSEEVRCMTMEELLDAAGGHVDLVQIDTEGHDFEILQSMNVDQLKPQIIRYEQLHMTRRQRDTAARRLADLGYRLITDKMDALCYLDRAA
jgi:FkbM family methyltransferase